MSRTMSWRYRRTARRQWVLWELRPFFREVARPLVLGSIAGIVMNIAIVLPAVLLGRAVDVIVRAEQHRAPIQDVAWAALAFVAATLATEVPRIGKRYWLSVAQRRIEASIRAGALRGVLGWPPERLASSPVGDVMARIIGDVEVLGDGIQEVMVETWDTLLFSISVAVTMVAYDPGLTAAALAPIPVTAIVAKRTGRIVATRVTHAREAAARLTDALRDQLGTFRLLRLFGRVGASSERIRSLAGKQAEAELAAIRIDQALGSVYTTLFSAGIIPIIWLGGHRVISGSMSVGGLVAFLQLFVRFTARAPIIPIVANRVQAAGAAYIRLRELLAPADAGRPEPHWSGDRSSSLSRVAGPRSRPARQRAGASRLCVRGVSFSYPGVPRPALTKIDFEVPEGALVAVTGPVGAGKSALAQLAVGLYAPDEGEVLLDGRPVAELTAQERASAIGYLSQEPQLFSGSVADNVALWEPQSTEHAVKLAVRVAALERDVAAMPEQLATQVGELGVRVSGGQRQRIGLARALAASGRLPGLLVLDDPFSAVDVETEQAIVSRLRGVAGAPGSADGRTSILLCSHRLAAFPLADQIVVLESGQVREQGTHRQLLDADGLYAHIFKAQETFNVPVGVTARWEDR